MLLSKDRFVIDALIKILSENYGSLEYDEEGSRGKDFLQVKKKNPIKKIDFCIAGSVKRALEKATNRSFRPPANVGTGDRNPNTNWWRWWRFNIRENKNPNLALSFAEVIADPEAYIDRLLTFEAIVKTLHHGNDVELYTNDLDTKFYIRTHGAPLYRLDAEGERIPIEPKKTYQFKCRIYEVSIRTDRRSVWQVYAEFIVSTNKKILHLPELVE